MLPNDMFLNLINLDLQTRIAIVNDFDGNAAEALKILLQTGPLTMTTGLQDWTMDTSNGQNILFYKGKNYIPKDLDL